MPDAHVDSPGSASHTIREPGSHAPSPVWPNGYIVPGVGRIGTRVRCREDKEVGGVQHPSEVTHTYPTPPLGQFEHTFDSFQTKVEVPVGAFTLNPGK